MAEERAVEARVVEGLVVGAGPAGLRAAEALAAAGRRVLVAEAMTSPARKFLMAGKSGLNLTKAEPGEAFAAPGYARLSFALGDDDLGEGIQRIADLLAK